MTEEERKDGRLHRFFDGDLPAEEEREIRRRLAAEPELRAKIEGLREVRALVRASVAPGLAELPSEELWARIEARLEGEGARASAARPESAQGVEAGASAEERARRPALRAIAGGGSGADGARGPAARADDGARTRRTVGVIIAGLALAAAILLIVVRPGEPPPGDGGTVADRGEADDGAGGPARDSAEEIVMRTEVLEVDFGSNSGAIFSVEGDHGERFAVVWLADVQPKPPGEGEEREPSSLE